MVDESHPIRLAISLKTSRRRKSIGHSVPGIAFSEGGTIARTSLFAWVDSLRNRGNAAAGRKPRGPQLGPI
jgi:hypothetical protein